MIGGSKGLRRRDRSTDVSGSAAYALLNERIAELKEWNARPMKKLGGISRRKLFKRIERGALLPLPQQRFELSEWKPVAMPSSRGRAENESGRLIGAR